MRVVIVIALMLAMLFIGYNSSSKYSQYNIEGAKYYCSLGHTDTTPTIDAKCSHYLNEIGGVYSCNATGEVCSIKL